MIVTRIEGEVRVVTQADHAALAADILELVRLPGLVDHPRRGRLLAAVRAHDDGWQESDAAPALAPDGRGPLDFRRLDARSRRTVWRRSVERLAGREAHGAALVATHFLRLAAPAADADPLWGAWIEALDARRLELSDGAGTRLEALEGDADWLALADQLSLAVVARDAALVRLPGWRARFRPGDPDELAFDPFPLAGPTRLRFGARQLPERGFTDPVELGLALAGARWQRLEIRLAALEP